MATARIDEKFEEEIQRFRDKLEEHGVEFAESLVKKDIVISLLYIIQSVERDPKNDFCPIITTEESQRRAAIADQALLLLTSMHELALEISFEQGWDVVGVNEQTGLSQFKNEDTGEETDSPHWRGQSWAISLLLIIPLLIIPLPSISNDIKQKKRRKGQSNKDDAVLWMVRVVDYHRHGSCPHALLSNEGGYDHFSIFDTVKTTDEGEVDVLREIVKGAWKGPFHSSDDVIDKSLILGSQLENWHSVSLNGLVLPSLSDNNNNDNTKDAPGTSLLVVGLYGGSLQAFLSNHVSDCRITTIEPSKALVDSVIRHFDTNSPVSATMTTTATTANTNTIPILTSSSTSSLCVIPFPTSSKTSSISIGDPSAIISEYRSSLASNPFNAVIVNVSNIDENIPDYLINDEFYLSIVTLLFKESINNMKNNTNTNGETKDIENAKYDNDDFGSPSILIYIGECSPETESYGNKQILINFIFASLEKAFLKIFQTAGTITHFQEQKLRLEDEMENGRHNLIYPSIIVGRPFKRVFCVENWCESVGIPSSGAMDFSKAQRTSVVRIPNFLSSKEIEKIHRLSKEAKDKGIVGRETRSDKGQKDVDGSSLWEVAYLHTKGHFDEQFSELKEKIIAAVRETDKTSEWNLIKNDKNFQIGVRVAEYHKMGTMGTLPDPKHYDLDSLITIDMMLTEPGVDYLGGHLQVENVDGSITRPEFNLGDAVLFVSHKPHHVTEVTKGTRNVLVVEIWKGRNCYCPHRCEAFGPLHCNLHRYNKHDNNTTTATASQTVDKKNISNLPFRLGSIGEQTDEAGNKDSVSYLLWEPYDSKMMKFDDKKSNYVVQSNRHGVNINSVDNDQSNNNNDNDNNKKKKNDNENETIIEGNNTIATESDLANDDDAWDLFD